MRRVSLLACPAVLHRDKLCHCYGHSLFPSKTSQTSSRPGPLPRVDVLVILQPSEAIQASNRPRSHGGHGETNVGGQLSVVCCIGLRTTDNGQRTIDNRQMVGRNKSAQFRQQAVLVRLAGTALRLFRPTPCPHSALLDKPTGATRERSAHY